MIVNYPKDFVLEKIKKAIYYYSGVLDVNQKQFDSMVDEYSKCSWLVRLIKTDPEKFYCDESWLSVKNRYIVNTLSCLSDIKTFIENSDIPNSVIGVDNSKDHLLHEIIISRKF
jgi:hypothetical protein